MAGSVVSSSTNISGISPAGDGVAPGSVVWTGGGSAAAATGDAAVRASSTPAARSPSRLLSVMEVNAGRPFELVVVGRRHPMSITRPAGACDRATSVAVRPRPGVPPGMPPAAGLRPDPAPLGDQGECGGAGDLLTARRDGNQTEGWGARLNPVPCTPPLGPAGVNPRREEITSRPGTWEEDTPRGLGRAMSVRVLAGNHGHSRSLTVSRPAQVVQVGRALNAVFQTGYAGSIPVARSHRTTGRNTTPSRS